MDVLDPLCAGSNDRDQFFQFRNLNRLNYSSRGRSVPFKIIQSCRRKYLKLQSFEELFASRVTIAGRRYFNYNVFLIHIARK